MDKQNNSIIDNGKVECACLAIYKALIGISELYLAEKAAKEQKYGSFRVFKAIQTYYVVYNIFASYMVLYDHIAQKIKNKYRKVNLDELNSEDESSMTWNRQRLLEQDLVTLVTHSQIKQFCDDLRNHDICPEDDYENSNALNVIINNFVSEESIDKYEKLCYIRDRSIYRPSFVISTDDSTVQTSKFVRAEIDSLPDSKKLYNILTDYFSSLLEYNEDMKVMLYFILYIRNDMDYLTKELSINQEDMKTLQEKGIMQSDYSVNSFFCHLMELEDFHIAIELYETFCRPFIQLVHDSL